MQLEKLSGTQLGNLVNKGEVSPTEVIRYFADRIEKRNPSINAFTYTKIEDAMTEAAEMESKMMQGYTFGPFAGVPVALKDFLPSKKGWTNSHGGVPALVRTDDADSAFYSAARSAGAIAVGKTNAPAFGFSGACRNEMYGSTKNPFNIYRTSGGSSGGSAAAVADGLVTFAEGGDAGGSIRIPASWCNLFGFKPSLGTVPSYCRPDGWTATHPYCFNGSLTKTVEDSATMLTLMAQYNPRDPMSLPLNSLYTFERSMDMPITGKKIAFTYDFDLFPAVDHRVKDAVYRSAVKLATESGCTIDEVHFNFKHTLDEILFCWAWAISVDTALDVAQWKEEGLDLFQNHRDELPSEFIKFNEYAAHATIHDFRKFNEIRTDILDNFEDVLEKYDYIISPVTVCPPFFDSWDGHCIEVDGHLMNSELSFINFGETPLVNFIGYPAASVPAGMITSGDSPVPIGMHIIGKQYHDLSVLAAARTFEQIQPWRDNYDLALNRM